MKKTFLMCVLVSFSFVASVAPLHASCKCANMSSEEMTSDMPCHNMQKSADSSTGTSTKTACTGCACGDCKTPSQNFNLHQPSTMTLIIQSVEHTAHQERIASYGHSSIYYPPKLIA